MLLGGLHSLLRLFRAAFHLPQEAIVVALDSARVGVIWPQNLFEDL